ncbi:NADH:ubiquinone/plastoquinone oxidoreductase, chain 3 [Phaffia rhodozyma]|uniref:NADH-ubiquinone oxidoreductase chain 2 n=1 Tax=Phaffia rhodozyma TaxID=264483 RepID=A0A0F7SFY0_PHARH|nr:NADH:ubiquinone/plastoquinone oxidoreductase, chain 3 [Phaffia rhodozyma]
MASGCILLSALDSAIFYLTLELQSYSAVLIASAFLESERSASASLLYFLVGGFASSLILLGLGLTYAATGCLALSVPETVESSYGLSLLALALVLASLPKLPLLFALYLWAAAAPSLILVSALASLVLGSLLGLSQSRVKRLLALSSVSHTGFILIAIVVLDLGSLSLYAGHLAMATLTVGASCYANWLLAPSVSYAQKASAYECGFTPLAGQTRAPFSVAFYLCWLLDSPLRLARELSSSPNPRVGSPKTLRLCAIAWS